MKEYTGKISAAKAKGLVKKASVCFDNQVRRCNCISNPRFKTYGAKGIKVDYTKRQFIKWFIDNYPKKMKAPSVGRIDHLRNYKFNNIRFEELSDNSIERINRIGSIKERKRIIIFQNDLQIGVVNSLNEASRFTGVCAGHISKYCNGKLNKSKEGYSFKYADKAQQSLNKSYINKNELRRKKVKIFDAKTNQLIIIAGCYKEAAEITGIQFSHIGRYCRGEIKMSKKGYRLEFA